MKLPFFKAFDIAGLHYAIRIFIGSCIAWLLMGGITEINPLWAVISVIAVTEPQMKTAWINFRSRAVNTVMGCACGLMFVLCFGIHNWLLPVGATFSAVVAIHLLRMHQGWRVAPITTVLVMSAGLAEQSEHGALVLALGRAVGVFTGSVVALLVTWLMTMIWMPKAVENQSETTSDPTGR